MRASSAPYFLFSPSDFSLGAVAEMRRMFQAACPAFHQPALRPTRGSGVGAVPETIGSTGLGMDFGGIGGGGGGVPRPPPRPAVAGAPVSAGWAVAGWPAAGAPGGGCGGGVVAAGAAGGCADGVGVAAGVTAGGAAVFDE